MAEQRDDLDRDLPLDDEDTKALGDDEFEDVEEDEDELEDQDELEERDRITGEVGSEGGSSGEKVRTRVPRGPTRGSEATETVQRR
jgi:hypothetical protein